MTLLSLEIPIFNGNFSKRQEKSAYISFGKPVNRPEPGT
jgi:hypothetical protein